MLSSAIHDLRTVGRLFGVMLMVFPAVASAADVGSLLEICSKCHAKNGLSEHSDVPIIAGQPYTLIEDNLRAFRAEERPCTRTRYRHGDTAAPPTSMCEIAGELNDGEMAALAEHFSTLEYVPVEQDFDPALAESGRAVHERGNCAMCHGEQGRQTMGLACRLAGQWVPYLAKAFREIRSGERFAPTVMAEPIQSFSDQEIEALLHFYASQASEWSSGEAPTP